MTKNNRAKLSFILCLALVLSLFAGVVPPVEAYAEEGKIASLDPAPSIGDISININNLPSLVVGETLPDTSSTTVTTNEDNLGLWGKVAWNVEFSQKYREIVKAALGDERFASYAAEVENMCR